METKRNPRLRNAIQLALGIGLASATLSAPVFSAEEESTELGTVTVTGSRLSRLDLEGALPVTVIDREQIEMSGQMSVADLMRGTSFNSAGSLRPHSGSSAQSFAGISLRGLGEGRTLVLIDGRRAPVAPNVGSAQDLNSIPLAAVERIEILSDGASAIYGSDAIGGVINIITRKDFTGAEFTVGGSQPSREGGDTSEFSLVMGTSGDRSQIMFGISRNHRGIVFQRDREWSAGGGSIFSNNFHVTPTPGDYYTNAIHGTAVPGDGCTGPAFTIAAPGPDSLCLFDFTGQAADEAELENQSIFTRATYELNSDWTSYFNASVSRVQSFGRYAPVPSSPWPGGLPFLEAGSPNHPATSPTNGGLNPEWLDYQDVANQDLYFSHRFAALGPRDDNTDAHVYDVNLGFEGTIGGFDIDAGIRNTESKYFSIGRNYVVGGLAQTFIQNGSYNIYDPFAVEDSVANSMITTINRESIFKAQELYAVASTDLFDMPAGMVSVAFGGEYRDESYVDNYDSLSEGGQVVGSAGNSAGGGRTVSALFFETLVPLWDSLEMNLAGRYDSYSNSGSDFSPKLSFRWQPTQQISVRTSFGQGFRAPTLDILTQKPAFSAAEVVHAPTAINFGVGATDGIQITTYSIANPDLSSETSDQFSLGIAFEPASWFSGSVDYYSIQISNQITEIDAQQIINCLEGVPGTACPPGLTLLNPNTLPPNVSAGLGMAFENGAGTPIQYGQTGFTNLGELQTDGLDVNLRAVFDAGAGQLNHNLQITHVSSYEVDGEELAGDVGRPTLRARVENNYSIGNFVFAYNINYIGPQDTSLAGPSVDGNGNAVPDPGVDSWLIHELQGNWYTPWRGRITVGVLNVTDEDPPLDAGEQRGFNFNLYDGYGRLPYLRYSQSF